MTDSADHEYNSSAIAVVGMAGRFPDARNVEEFWRNLKDGVESVRPLDDDALRAAGVNASLLEDPHYVKAGVEMPDMEKFDAGFFGLSALDASIMDPQHRHFLECCWETLESAGHEPGSFEGSIGVFAGSGHNAYFARNLLTNPDLVDQVGFFLLRHTGNDKDFLATRASYQLDLKGPSVNVQTACSTSLVAVHMACQSLLSGECDMALAGAVTIELPHRRGYLTREGEILSTDGHCRPFEARSNGTVFGSATGLVALRRIDDAEEDGDTILAVIRGTAVNNDGSGKIGYLAPSVDGQSSVIAEALQIAEVEPGSIGFIEAHGTGTAVGDPIEVAALAQVFEEVDAPNSCALGSVKSNIGHADTAAGVVGMIKVIQALRHGQIPPTLHFEAPNPEIDFASTPFYVNAALAEWPARLTPRRAGISSLGVGGTNAHVILEEGPSQPERPHSRALQILPISARTEAAVENATDRLADHLRAHSERSLADVAYTLQTGRKHFARRRVVIASDAATAAKRLEVRDTGTSQADTDSGSVAFMFPGGGAQYPNMGRGLYETEPVYRAQVDELLESLSPDFAERLRGLLFPDPGSESRAAEELQRPSLQLPLIFITEFALAKLWMSWGLQPDALIGHSMGENTAACLAGVIRPADALALVSLRGRLFEKVPDGGMLSVGMDSDAVAALLGTELCVASVNAPDLCVVSGPRQALDSLAVELESREVSTQRIQIDVAAHSAMLDPILEEWGAFLQNLELSPPKIPFVSNLSGTWISDEDATDPSYWVRHLRGRVRFADGVETLLKDANRSLLEVGPGKTLATLASMTAGPRRSVSNSMRHPEDESADLEFLLGALGRLWLGGVRVDWRALHGKDERRRVPLPTYAFDHERHWIEPGSVLHEEGVAGAGLERHPDLADWFYLPTWKRAPLPPRLDETGPILAYVEGGPFSKELVARLRENGGRVITVEAGASFERRDENAYRIRPTSAEDIEALLEALVSEGAAPRVIAQLWNVGPMAEPSSLLDVYSEVRNRAFSSLMALAQAIGNLDWADPVELVVLSSGMQQVGGEVPTEPLRSLLLGPSRVIAAEYPNVRARSVDLDQAEIDASDLRARLVDDLAQELTTSGGEAVVAWRGGRRLLHGFERTPLAHAGPKQALRPDGVYLITGGLGGLGGLLAEHLAREVGARLVLLTRSRIPPRDRWDAILESRPSWNPIVRHIRQIRSIEAAGSEVMIGHADVCDAAAMKAVMHDIRERFGALHGVYHTAGVLDDALIQLKSIEDAEKVLAPKVRGTLILDEVTRDFDLDFLALYSSVSALAGLPGQVDYAAACSFLDAFAAYRSAKGHGRTTSVAWGPWQEIGMAADQVQAERIASGRAESEPLGHPLLESYLGTTRNGELFATDFSVDRHWLLDEHRLAAGDALIPGTGYLELAAAGLRSCPESAAVEISDVFLAAPFVVPDDASRRLCLQLDRESGEFVFLSGTPGGPDEVEHVRGVVRYREVPEARAHDLSAIRDRCDAAQSVDAISAQESQLRFGPRWDCVRSLAFGKDEALADLELPKAYLSDLSELMLHPAMLDMATGCAHSLIPGFDSRVEFCVPMSYSRVLVSRPLPARFFAHLRIRGESDPNPDFAVFDVLLLDEAGVEFARVDEFMLKRIRDRADLISAPIEQFNRTDLAQQDDESEASALAKDLAQATRPDEGLAALDRILAAGSLEHVVVLPQDLEGWIAARKAAQAPPVIGFDVASISPELLAELVETEEILKSHEAVADAAMTAHFDRPGGTRRLAHIAWDPDQHATVSELRKFLRERVAHDLLPQNFVELDSIPRVEDGTVDRAALDDPYGIADDYVAPRSVCEKTIARVWQETLRIDRVGIYDNFFDIGGHSLLAMRAIVRTEKKLGVRLNNAIMVLQTLEQVAAECERSMPASPESEVVSAPSMSGKPDQPPTEAESDKPKSLSSRLLSAVRRSQGAERTTK